MLILVLFVVPALAQAGDGDNLPRAKRLLDDMQYQKARRLAARVLASAERFSDNAMRFGSLQVNTLSSRSSALLSLVTFPDHFFIGAFFIFPVVRFDPGVFIQDPAVSVPAADGQIVIAIAEQVQGDAGREHGPGGEEQDIEIIVRRQVFLVRAQGGDRVKQ